tara:strand:+ start:12943 stop:17019 length:4077 start_codon:yes stop_codon:yes gene_type:complete
MALKYKSEFRNIRRELYKVEIHDSASMHPEKFAIDGVDGGDNYIELSTGIDTSTDAWTVSFWISNYEQGSLDWFIGSNTTAKNIGFNHSGQVFFRDSDWAYHDFDYQLPEGGVDNRLTFVSNGTTISLYVNGELEDSITPATTQLLLYNLGRGYQSGGVYDYQPKCRFNDFQYYDKAWTVNDVSYDYEHGSKLVTSRQGTAITNDDLKVWYKLDEGTGLVATDSSGNENDGTIGGGLWQSETDLLLNGDFATGDLEGWGVTATGDGVAPYYDSGSVVISNGASGGLSYVYQQAVMEVGKAYTLTYEVTANSGSGSLVIAGPEMYIPNTVGVHTVEFTATTQTSFILKRGGANVNVHLDNITLVKQAAEFTCRGNGFDLSYQGGDKTYDLIKPSNLTFIMNVDNATLNQFPKDIIESTESRFSIRVYKDDTYSSENDYTPTGLGYKLFWLGFINKRIMSKKDDCYPFDLKVVCTDGIQSLKNKDFKKLNGDTFQGTENLVGYLTDIIDLLDVGNAYGSNGLALATRVNWYEGSHSTSNDMCKYTYLYKEAFTTINDSGETKFSTYYDVLNQICKTFQCRFLMNDGKFYFSQFHRQLVTNTYFLYKKDGSVDASELTSIETVNTIAGEYGGVYATGIDLTTAQAGFYNRASTFGGKLNSVKIKGNNAGANLLPLDYFPRWQTPNTGWSGFGGDLTGPNLSGYFEDGDDVNYQLRVKMKIRVTRATDTATNQFFGRVRFPFWLKVSDNNNVATVDRYWKPTIGSNPAGIIPDSDVFAGATATGGQWVDQPSGGETWADSAIMFRTGVFSLQTTSEVGYYEEYDFDINITTNISTVPEAGGVFVYNDYAGGWDSALGDGDWFAIEKMDGTIISREDSFCDGYTIEPIYESVELFAFRDGEGFTGSTVDSYVSNNESSGGSEELVISDLLFRDGPTSGGINTIYIDENDGSGTLAQSTEWKVDGAGTASKVHKLISDEILNFNYIEATRLESTLIEPPISYYKKPLNPINGFSRTYVDEDGTDIFDEIYSFESLTYRANESVWSFKGRLINKFVAPDIEVVDIEEPIEDNTGLAPMESVASGDTVLTTVIENDSICKLNEVITPDDTGTTSVAITALDYDVPSGKTFQIQSSSQGYKFEVITLGANAEKGDTSLTINTWNPDGVYDTSSRIIPTAYTLAHIGGSSGGASVAGSDKEVQFNDGGVLGAESGFEYDKSTNTLTSDNIEGDYYGNNIGNIYEDAIFITPLDFTQLDDDRYYIYTETEGGSSVVSSSGVNAYAQFQIPKGYKATSVDFYSNSNDTFSVYLCTLTTGTSVLSHSGTTNTTLSLGSGINAVKGKYNTIEWNPSSTSDEIYGVKITIAKI